MNYCNCPNCRTDNCPAGVEHEQLTVENMRLKANNLLGSDALKSPLDVFEVIKRDDLQRLKDQNATLRDANKSLAESYGRQFLKLREELSYWKGEAHRLQDETTDQGHANK